MLCKDTFVFVVHADAWSVNFVFVLPFKPPTFVTRIRVNASLALRFATMGLLCARRVYVD